MKQSLSGDRIGYMTVGALMVTTWRLAIVLGSAVMLLLSGSFAAAQERTAPPARRSDRAIDMARFAEQQRAWNKQLVDTPLSVMGCFQTEYPDTQLHRVQCVKPPNIPFPPRHGPLPDNVGNGYDYSAQVSGKLLSVTGSFPVAMTTGETGFTFQSPTAQQADAYTLQINSSFFKSPSCNGAMNPLSCQAWQQYVYSSRSSGTAFMQYWLINYGSSCPGGWTSYSGSCYRNSASAVTVPVIPATSLAQTSFTGSVSKGGNDRLDLSAGGTHYVMTSPDSMVNLADNWTAAEFTLVGDCCGYAANFNAGTNLAVTTTVHSGAKTAPACLLEGFTGETNNLNLQHTPPLATQASPTVLSDQGSTAVGLASCATASGVGDTHLHTFTSSAEAREGPATNLSYDFQAQGDFVLALTRSGFQVQNRQVSGGQQWPNTAINKAVAAAIGRTVVIFDLESGAPQVYVNGAVATLNDGEKRVLGEDGDLRRSGNTYAVRDTHGNSVQAVFQPQYIDVYVGLGMWPSDVGGLLAHAQDNVRAVASRGGQIFPQPFTLPTFYTGYGDSWRVRSDQSLFARPSGAREPVRRNPDKPFYASDLPRPVLETARAQCVSAGVQRSRLDDCTLDFAVLGRDAVQSHLDRRTISTGAEARIQATPIGGTRR